MSDSLETPTKSPKQRSRHWLSPEDWKVACEIADQLHESEKPVRRQIMSLVKDMGVDFAQEVQQQTLAVEAGGLEAIGLLTNRNSNAMQTAT